MFIHGRNDRQSAGLKRPYEEVQSAFQKWGNEYVNELTHKHCMTLLNRYKKMKHDVLKIEESFNALETSSLLCSVPVVEVKTIVTQNRNIEDSVSNQTGPTYSELSWNELEEIIIKKCQEESEERRKIHDFQVQSLLKAKLFPQIVLIDPYIKDMQNDNYKYVANIMTNYNNICQDYIDRFQDKLKDKLISIKKSGVDVIKYPVIETCNWLDRFLENVETFSYGPNITDHTSYMERRFYIWPFHYIKEDGKRIKSFTLDLPYHMCRFLSLFSNVLFCPDESFSGLGLFEEDKMERISDTQLLIHFAIKYYNDELYKEFLKDPYTCYENRFEDISMSIKNAVRELVNTPYSIKDIAFKVDRDGQIKLVRNIIGNIENKDAGSFVKVNYEKVSIPQSICNVLRSFILRNSNQFIENRKLACKQNQLGRFEDEYFEYINSPLSKLLNFDSRAVSDFKKLRSNKINSQSQLAMNYHFEIPTMNCIYRIYLLLLQAAFALLEVCDPIDFNIPQIRSPSFINDIIVKGDVVGHQGILLFIPIFEAFPGLFYLHFFYKILPSNNDLNLQDDIRNIYGLFDFFSRNISMISKTDLDQKNI